ncbi:hypothetical protein SAM40697_6924 [Streptomyces ambofaciens]|uniref:Uncharacterized protein n=1 Tax=Streptomyces ambofaciens TaxID=1889 RepID=Q0JWS3_STRAM|nr:hypothetical protein [Streptomyces ambofaciens]ANB03965.1 hypothetical protein SAM40697_0001 [Streptomyces ambofaciens]ANB10875.1 hypothetical protein SAM40697_6924 [Streptomyces ambofaciens]CAK50845.1 hypothetical protein DSMT0001 [Streptomyces ambofaciens]CAK51083.1 hypothetical protein DSMT0001 [Streptomyces ambofaciens]
MLSALSPSTVLGVPGSLALLAAVVLVPILLLVAAVAWVALRRVDRADLPVALLGLAHVISALCGLLPWGRPTPPPALPQPAADDPEPPAAAPTVVLVRPEPTTPAVVRSAE